MQILDLMTSEQCHQLTDGLMYDSMVLFGNCSFLHQYYLCIYRKAYILQIVDSLNKLRSRRPSGSLSYAECNKICSFALCNLICRMKVGWWVWKRQQNRKACSRRTSLGDCNGLCFRSLWNFVVLRGILALLQFTQQLQIYTVLSFHLRYYILFYRVLVMKNDKWRFCVTWQYTNIKDLLQSNYSVQSDVPIFEYVVLVWILLIHFFYRYFRISFKGFF